MLSATTAITIDNNTITNNSGITQLSTAYTTLTNATDNVINVISAIGQWQEAIDGVYRIAWQWVGDDAEPQTANPINADGLNYGFGDFHVENMPADIRLPQRPAHVAITQEAIARARTLLLACLSDAQREAFEAHGYFEVVTASGQRYRITRGWGGNVLLIVNDKPAARFCIHPSQYVPEEDNMLAQKLLLEHDEPTFLRTANRSAA